MWWILWQTEANFESPGTIFNNPNKSSLILPPGFEAGKDMTISSSNVFLKALSALDTAVGKSLNSPHSQSDGQLHPRSQGVGQGSTEVMANHVFKGRTARKSVTLFSFLHDKEKLGVGLNSSKVGMRKLLGFWVSLGLLKQWVDLKAVAWIYISYTQGFNPLLSFRMQGGTGFQLHWEFRSTLLTQRKKQK